FSSMTVTSAKSTLVPYTTLFRSQGSDAVAAPRIVVFGSAGGKLPGERPQSLVELLALGQTTDRPRAIAAQAVAHRPPQVTITAAQQMLLHDVKRGPPIHGRIPMASRCEQLVRRQRRPHRRALLPTQPGRPLRKLHPRRPA